MFFKFSAKVNWLAGMSLLLAATLSSSVLAQSITRLTFNQGNDFIPAWDPRGTQIVYLRPKTPQGSVIDAYRVDVKSPGNESVFLNGLNQDFGVAVALSWIGSTGLLAVEEAISGFEVLRFDTSFAPFNRTVQNGADVANTILLSINAGGGQSLTKVSRDGSTALIRFSTSGSGGNVTFRSGSVSSMSGFSGNFGTVLLSDNVGADPRYYNGAALSPDGSKFIISVPLTTSTSPHDLMLGSTTGAFSNVNLTNTASGGITNVFPEFSPDGQKIVFARKVTGGGAVNDLYMMNIDGSNVTQLTNTPFFEESYPSFSPDGSQLAFSAVHSTNHERDPPVPLGDAETANHNIYALTLPPTPTPTPTITPSSAPTAAPTAAPTPGIVTPQTKLTDPPVVTLSNRNVTFVFVAFSEAQFGNARRVGRAAKPKAKVSFNYELVITRPGKNKETIRKTSKRNSITVKNIKPGSYNAKYRVQISRKEPKKPVVVKNTKFSPPARFTVT